MGLWKPGIERARAGKPRLEDVHNMVEPMGLQFLTVQPATTETETKTVSVDSLWDYLRVIAELNGANDNLPIYRGQPNTAFKLLPKIGRKTLKYKYAEKDMFLEFKRNYRRYYPEVLTRDMDILMLGQHYGLPTRLLDWTTNSLVALYFACCTNYDNDGVVYLKDLRKDNRYKDVKEDVDPFSLQENIVFFPELFDIRFANQNGLFEIYAKPDVESPTTLKAKIIIKGHDKEAVSKQLEMIGMNPAELFPTLDNLCRFIEGSYFI